MNIPSSEQVLELVQIIEHTSKQFNELLEKESAILATQDNEQLLALSNHKKEMVLSLEKQTKTLHIFLHSLNINNGLYALSDLISNMPESKEQQLLSTTWLNIQSLSDSNKKLNEVNGSIIELNRRHTQRSLDVLRGQVGTTNSTYGADGQSMKGKISRNISVV